MSSDNQMSADTHTTQVQIFEACCPKCHKSREIHAKDGIVGTKTLNVVECICGYQIPIEILHYMFRQAEFIDGDILIF